ncbi:MAG: rhomboid family intramembrane serine protease [Bacteroidota bacterium]
MFPIRDSIPTRQFPIVNTVLIVLNILIFVLIQPAGGTEQEAIFFHVFGLVPERYLESGGGLLYYLPFLSNMFLHGGWLHLIGNVWTLYIFGDNVEDRMGRGRYLVFYLLCGLLGSLAHMATNWGSPIPAIGASGAISGVMGAYLLLCPKSRISMLIPIFYIPFFFKIPAWAYLIYWFILQFLSGTQELFSAEDTGAGVAFWAHIGGFVAGLGLKFLFEKRNYEAPEQFRSYKQDPKYLKYRRSQGMYWDDNLRRP